MSRLPDMLWLLGQRAFWGLQGALMVVAFGSLRAPPAAAPALAAPEVHVHLPADLVAKASAPVAPAPPPPTPSVVWPSSLQDPPESVRNAAEQQRCVQAQRAGGILWPSSGGAVVERRVLLQALEDQSTVMRSARLVPEKVDGRVWGVRMFGVLPGSLAARLGLLNGDTVRMVNGFTLESPERSLQLYAMLRSSAAIHVEVERRGQPVLLTWRLC